MNLESMTLRRRASHLVIYIILAMFAIVAIFPFAWMISASLKFDTQVFNYPIEWIPANPQWGNYLKVFEKFNFLQYFKNTAVVTILVTLGTLLASILASYAFAKLNFRGRDTLFLLYIATLMIPLIRSLASPVMVMEPEMIPATPQATATEITPLPPASSASIHLVTLILFSLSKRLTITERTIA